MSFTGIPLVLDQWFDVGGGKVCNLTAARVFSSQPIEEAQGPGAPPADGMFAWYKADAQTYNNNDVTNIIVDSSPNGRNLSGGGAGPVFKTNVLNGKPVFLYNIFRTSSFTVSPSVNPPGFSTAYVTRRTDFDAIRSGTAIGAASPIDYRLQSFDSAPSNIRFENNAGTGAFLTVPGGTWQIVTHTFDDTEGIARLKTNLLSDSSSAGPASASITSVFLQYWGNGEIAEAVLYAKKLSDTELHDLRAYLSAKYAIAII